MMKGLGFTNKKGAAFGAYGWSGESTKIITSKLNEAGFSVVNDGIRAMWYPDDRALNECREFGRRFVKEL